MKIELNSEATCIINKGNLNSVYFEFMKTWAGQNFSLSFKFTYLDVCVGVSLF